MTITEVVTTGSLLVFGLLVLIIGVLYLLPIILRLFGIGGKKESKPTPKPIEQPKMPEQPKAPSNESQIVAAIMAAITAYEEAQGNPRSNFRVVSFKRIERRRA